MTGTKGRDTTAVTPQSVSLGRERGAARMSARTRRRVAIAGVAALVPVAAALLLVLAPNKNPPPERISTVPAQEPEPRVKAPLTDEARRVAMRFIQTAVAREHLEEAWTLVGPNLRGGMTKERWISGANPVVPYPIDKLDVAPYKVDESF